MSLTFGRAKDILAQYAGKGGKLPTDEDAHNFTRQVLQYLLISGSPDCERVMTLYAQNGHVTAPYELQTPLKVQVNGRIGNVVSKWFDFHSGNDIHGRCYEAHDVLHEDPNEYYTVYDLPPGGARIGVMGHADEDSKANIIISGDDPTGREIHTNHKGADIPGEYLSIQKNQIVWSNVIFGNIAGIIKSPTQGYVSLYWKSGDVKGFLADYSPVEQAPTYRRFKISLPECATLAKITVLGRIRLKEHYADTDRIPFDNEYTIRVAGQQNNNQYNEKYQEAQVNDKFLQNLTGREADYKKPNNGQVVEVFHALSGGTVRGIGYDRRR